ncbi:hypothetical protein MAP00_007890 [Monascus purpureus]|nr:hypothetical protein MAP00_007890 [Monascus purpureus]
MTTNRIAFRVHGVVQGVGFRDFTQRRAVYYGLKGWVKNTTDGRVEGEAQGDEDSIQKLLKDIGQGPRLAHVVKVEKKEVPPRGDEEGFSCRVTSGSTFYSSDS